MKSDFPDNLLALDLCAAPGGKSIQLAQRLRNGTLISNEIDRERARILYSNIEKEYLVRVIGHADKNAVSKLVRGVVIDGYKTKPAEVEVIEYKKDSDTSLMRIVITEGKYHQVKKMCDAVGLPVKRLTRLRFATISTEGIAKGQYRKLKIHEVKQLYNL